MNRELTDEDLDIIARWMAARLTLASLRWEIRNRTINQDNAKRLSKVKANLQAAENDARAARLVRPVSR